MERERDFDKRPYSLDERRVVKYLQEIMPEVGAGDDPIGFLIASHVSLLHLRLFRPTPLWERKDAGC